MPDLGRMPWHARRLPPRPEPCEGCQRTTLSDVLWMTRTPEGWRLLCPGCRSKRAKP